jgi:hypothetical protein
MVFLLFKLVSALVILHQFISSYFEIENPERSFSSIFERNSRKKAHCPIGFNILKVATLAGTCYYLFNVLRQIRQYLSGLIRVNVLKQI